MPKLLRHVDLCSGIGGFALGFQWAGLSRPVLFCDIEAWSRRVLAKHWPNVPIEEDVKELASDPARLVPDCDILSCGYPCQPFSQAGIRRGEEDDRHIWPEIFTIIEAKRPRWIVCENVVGHLSLGLDKVLSDLADKAGYEVQTFCVGAVAVDAPHRRQRIWVVANSDSAGLRWAVRRGQAETQGIPGRHIAKCSSDVAHADSQRRRGGYANRQDASDAGQPSRCQRHDAGRVETRQPLAFMGGMADGLPKGLDRFDGWEREPEDIPRVTTGIKQRAARLKGLGNAIVPQIAMQIGLTIKAVEINCGDS